MVDSSLERTTAIKVKGVSLNVAETTPGIPDGIALEFHGLPMILLGRPEHVQMLIDGLIEFKQKVWPC